MKWIWNWTTILVFDDLQVINVQANSHNMHAWGLCSYGGVYLSYGVKSHKIVGIGRFVGLGAANSPLLPISGPRLPISHEFSLEDWISYRSVTFLEKIVTSSVSRRVVLARGMILIIFHTNFFLIEWNEYGMP